MIDSAPEYTPKSIMDIFNSVVEIKPDENWREIVVITGIYFKNSKCKYPNEKGYYHDYLKDEKEQNYIVLYINQIYNREQLQSGSVYNFIGYFNKIKQKDGFIATNLTIPEFQLVKDRQPYEFLHSYDPLTLEEKKLKSDIINYKYKYKFDLESILKDKLLKKKHVVIAVIVGEESEVYEDLKLNSNDYTTERIDVIITDKKSILGGIKNVKLYDPDIIALVRGGGDFMDFLVFNDLDIIKAVLDLNMPFITAIGHADDNNYLIQYISTEDFATPSKLGSGLNSIALKISNEEKKEEDTKSQFNNVEDAITNVCCNEELKKENEKLKKDNKKLNEQLNSKNDSSGTDNKEIKNLKEKIEELKCTLAKSRFGIFIFGVIIGFILALEIFR